ESKHPASKHPARHCSCVERWAVPPIPTWRIPVMKVKLISAAVTAVMFGVATASWAQTYGGGSTSPSAGSSSSSGDSMSGGAAGSSSTGASPAAGSPSTSDSSSPGSASDSSSAGGTSS